MFSTRLHRHHLIQAAAVAFWAATYHAAHSVANGDPVIPGPGPGRNGAVARIRSCTACPAAASVCVRAAACIAWHFCSSCVTARDMRESVSLALCLFVRSSLPACAPPGRVPRAVLDAVLWLRLCSCACACSGCVRV